MASGIWQELRTNGRRSEKLATELRELTAARRDLIDRALEEGIPVAMIARELRISTEAVYKFLRSRREPAGGKA